MLCSLRFSPSMLPDVTPSHAAKSPRSKSSKKMTCAGSVAASVNKRNSFTVILRIDIRQSDNHPKRNTIRSLCDVGRHSQVPRCNPTGSRPAQATPEGNLGYHTWYANVTSPSNEYISIKHTEKPCRLFMNAGKSSNLDSGRHQQNIHLWVPPCSSVWMGVSSAYR